jgi:hypothetical protein
MIGSALVRLFIELPFSDPLATHASEDGRAIQILLSFRNLRSLALRLAHFARSIAAGDRVLALDRDLAPGEITAVAADHPTAGGSRANTDVTMSGCAKRSKP